MVDPQIRKSVPDGKVGPAKFLSEEEQTSERKTETDIRHHNEPSITGLVQRAGGIEVVDATAEAVSLALAASLALSLVVVVTGDVGEEVVGPADELLSEEVDEGVDGSLLGQLGELVGEAAKAASTLLTGAGDEDHVTLHVASSLVVLAVADLPAEVGNQESRVEDPADNVVKSLRGRESAVAALVGENPETGSEKTLKEGVDAPEDDAEGLGGNVLGSDEVVPDGECDGEVDHVTEDIGHALDVRPLVAVLGDGIADVLDGVVGHLEHVSVRINQLAIALGAGGLHIVGGEGGQRGRRGRLTGRANGAGIGGRGRGVGVDSSSAPQEGVLSRRLAGGCLCRHFRKNPSQSIRVDS